MEEPPRRDPRGGGLTELPAEARARLRQHALAAVVAALRGRPRPAPPPGPGDPRLAAARGVFVSVYVGDELRGCLGSVEARDPLLAEVGRLAAQAACEDPRFRAIHPGELPALRVEISVLGECRRVAGPGEVEPGRHGVVVRRGDRTGVLLPQVGARHGWDGATLVRQAAVKAGIAPDEPGALSIAVFEAEVF